MSDRAPIISITAEFAVDCIADAVEAFVVFHERGGDVRYRLLQWDPATQTFLAATSEGEAILKERGKAALRNALIVIGEGLGE